MSFDPRPAFPALLTPIAPSHGQGSPEGVYFGNPGQTYWDELNNQLYLKDAGAWNTTGWMSVSPGAGGTGAGFVLSGHGPPTGAPGGSAVNDGVYLDIDSGIKYQWNGTDWV